MSDYDSPHWDEQQESRSAAYDAYDDEPDCDIDLEMAVGRAEDAERELVRAAVWRVSGGGS